METIIWFLVIGAVFYFMMRMGGCGAHGHGGHPQHGGGVGHGAGSEGGGAWTVTDPVCGAKGPAGTAAASAEHDGKMFYFCSEQCRDRFVQEPRRYLAANETPAGGHHGC